MQLLHAVFVNGSLAVWGETEPETTELKEQWPYAMNRATLQSALSHVGLHSAETQEIIAWLPTANGRAIPSSPIFGDANHNEATLAPWIVPAIFLSPETATEFLKVEESKIEDGLFYSTDVLYWSQVLRFVRRLIQGQKFLPWLEHNKAQWIPLLIGEEHLMFQEMSHAMPPVCRAFSTHKDGPPLQSSQKVLFEFVRFFLDQTIRNDGTYIPIEASTTHDVWLNALQQKFAVMEKSAEALQQLEDSLHAWTEPVLRLANFGYRLAFRLEEPTPKRDYWRVRYFLQKLDDPSLLIPAAHLWTKKRSARQVLRGDFDRAEQNLLMELAQAGRIDPYIQMSLHRPAPNGYQTDTKGAWEFLETKAWILQDSGYGVLLPSWWGQKKGAYRLRLRGKAKSPKAFPGVKTNVLIDFDWKFAVGDREITYKELIALAKLKQPLVKFRGKWIALRPEEIAAAVDFWKNKRNESGTLFDLMRFIAGDQAGELPIEGVEAEGWVADFLFNFREHAKYELISAPENFAGQLRPYQQRGFSWLHFMKEFGIGSCLADDMGLGKTVQTIALLDADLGQENKALIVCPTSVVGNWQRELARFGPDLDVEVHHGISRKKGEEFAVQLQGKQVVISSYALLLRDFDLLRSIRWRAVILDEAQNIKNADTKQARAARSLQADYRIALTGTPIENNVGELWSIMEFLNRGLLGSKADFQRKYFVPIHKEANEQAMEELKRISGPFLLRRLKSDPLVISDLPKKMEMKVFCNLTREQGSLYAAVVRELEKELGDKEIEGIQRRGKILAAITKLKQICNHPAHFLQDRSSLEGRSGKLARLTEMLEEIVLVNERSLIFTQFAEMGELLRVHLQNYFGKEAAFLHGGVPRKKREDLVDRFNGDEQGPPFFVLSLKAGGTGLNLTGANHVFHFDRWWNPAVEDQATDRAYRIGQKKNVQVHKFVCVGTLEERIDEILEKKKNLASTVIGAGEAWLTELSTTEIKSLIALSKDAVAV